MEDNYAEQPELENLRAEIQKFLTEWKSELDSAGELLDSAIKEQKQFLDLLDKNTHPDGKKDILNFLNGIRPYIENLQSMFRRLGEHVGQLKQANQDIEFLSTDLPETQAFLLDIGHQIDTIIFELTSGIRKSGGDIKNLLGSGKVLFKFEQATQERIEALQIRLRELEELISKYRLPQRP